MKVTYTEEAVADIVEAITYLNERNPTAAATGDEDLRDDGAGERGPAGLRVIRHEHELFAPQTISAQPQLCRT